MGSLAENTSGGSIAYRTSKAAVNIAMRSVSAELAPRDITCVMVNPGWVKTRMGGASAPLPVQESVATMQRACSRDCGVAIQASSSTTTVASIRGEQDFSTCGFVPTTEIIGVGA